MLQATDLHPYQPGFVGAQLGVAHDVCCKFLGNDARNPYGEGFLRRSGDGAARSRPTVTRRDDHGTVTQAATTTLRLLLLPSTPSTVICAMEQLGGGCVTEAGRQGAFSRVQGLKNCETWNMVEFVEFRYPWSSQALP